MSSPAEIDLCADPRLTGEYLRQIAGSSEITLVGVVHDHPASIYRTQAVINAVDPAVLALELPPISIPLFEAYANTEASPPAFGGEMSAAIQAAAPDSAVGIDRPTGGFFHRLGRKLLEEQPTVETVRNLLSNITSTTKHAVVCRVAAVLASQTSVRIEVDSPNTYDTDQTDSAPAQARDERQQIRRSRSFMNAFQTSNRSRASQIEDAAREADMATRLSALQAHGDVVAVVGIDHLDSLAERLEE